MTVTEFVAPTLEALNPSNQTSARTATSPTTVDAFDYPRQSRNKWSPRHNLFQDHGFGPANSRFDRRVVRHRSRKLEKAATRRMSRFWKARCLPSRAVRVAVCLPGSERLATCSVRKQADADRIVAEVSGLRGRYTPLIFDVTDAEGVAAAVRQVDEALSGATLTALINNAGRSLKAFSREEWMPLCLEESN